MKDQVITIGMRDKYDPTYKLINVTSKGTEKWKLLSPSVVSDVWCYSSLSARTMQNAWVYSQVYEEMDDHGVPKNPEWYDWRDRGFARKNATYYPMGGRKDLKPLYTHWGDAFYGKLEARKHIYIPLYHRSLRNNQAMKHLRKLYKDGVKLAIRDFDCYPMGDKTFEEILRDTDAPFGHGFVLWNDLVNDGEI